MTCCFILVTLATGRAAPDGWRIHDQGDRYAPSAWSQNGDVIVQASNIYGGDANTASPLKPGTLAISELGVFSDFALRVDLRSQDDDGIGVVFRYRDPENYYLFSMDRQRRFRRLVKMQAGKPAILAEDTVVYERNRWYRVEVQMVQDRMKLSLDGTLIFSGRDGMFAAGEVGLYCWGNAGSDFGGFEVTGLRPTSTKTAIDRTAKTEPVAASVLPAAYREQKAGPADSDIPAVPAGGHPAGDAGEAPPDAADASAGGAYIIGTGDILNISVWKEPSLTQRVTVLPDGTVSFPLVGMLTVAGRTLDDIKREIGKKIAEFVPDPVLTISVQQVNSMIIYVIGRVNRPGHFPLNRNINVLQALAMAGGLNPFAKEKEIRIFRDNGSERVSFPFNYKEVSAGESTEQNICLERGDVIVVP